MQIETTRSYHFPPIRLAKIQKFSNMFSWGDSGETSALLHSWWECKVVRSHRRVIWQKRAKLLVYSTQESHYWKSTPAGIIKEVSTRFLVFGFFIATRFVIAKDWGQGKRFSAETVVSKPKEGLGVKETKEELNALLQARSQGRDVSPWSKAEESEIGCHHLPKKRKEAYKYRCL